MFVGARTMPDLGSGEDEWMGLDDDHQYSRRCRGRFDPNEDRSPIPSRRGLRVLVIISYGRLYHGTTGPPPLQSTLGNRVPVSGWGPPTKPWCISWDRRPREKELFDITTGHASGEDSGRAIYGRRKRKAGHDKGLDEGVDDQLDTKGRIG